MRANHLLGLFIAFGTTACATDGVPDELAGESDADDAGKADGNGAFTYWQVQLAADTGGYRVTRPNRTVNECGGGVRGASCDVSIDLAPTAMPASVARSYEDRLRAGETLLLRGELGTERPELRYARLSTMAGPAIAAADLAAPAVGGPNVHVGDENGPDCLYARLFVQDVDVSGAEITVTPNAGGAIEFRARFTGVSMPSKSEYAITCVNGSASVDVKATALTASGVMTVAADGSIAFPAMTYQFEGLSYASTMPSAINDMLFGNTDAIGNIVTSSVGVALAPMINKRALLATEVWTPGSTDASDLSGVFVIAKQDAAGVLERRLNSTRFASIEELDLAASGASADAVARAEAAFAAGDEVILVGYRYKDGDTRGRAANQFWTKAPVPLH